MFQSFVYAFTSIHSGEEALNSFFMANSYRSHTHTHKHMLHCSVCFGMFSAKNCIILKTFVKERYCLYQHDFSCLFDLLLYMVWSFPCLKWESGIKVQWVHFVVML